MAARITSIGKGVPMIPVEETRTCALSMPSASAAAALIASASAMPAAPVPALALPELTIDRRRLAAARGEALAVEHHRRRDELVLREHADRGDGLAVVGGEQGHVIACGA